jgi:hypothetical protein
VTDSQTSPSLSSRSLRWCELLESIRGKG